MAKTTNPKTEKKLAVKSKITIVNQNEVTRNYLKSNRRKKFTTAEATSWINAKAKSNFTPTQISKVLNKFKEAGIVMKLANTIPSEWRYCSGTL